MSRSRRVQQALATGCGSMPGATVWPSLWSAGLVLVAGRLLRLAGAASCAGLLVSATAPTVNEIALPANEIAPPASPIS